METVLNIDFKKHAYSLTSILLLRLLLGCLGVLGVFENSLDLFVQLNIFTLILLSCIIILPVDFLISWLLLAITKSKFSDIARYYLLNPVILTLIFFEHIYFLIPFALICLIIWTIKYFKYFFTSVYLGILIIFDSIFFVVSPIILLSFFFNKVISITKAFFYIFVYLMTIITAFVFQSYFLSGQVLNLDSFFLSGYISEGTRIYFIFMAIILLAYFLISRLRVSLLSIIFASGLSVFLVSNQSFSELNLSYTYIFIVIIFLLQQQRSKFIFYLFSLNFIGYLYGSFLMGFFGEQVQGFEIGIDLQTIVQTFLQTIFYGTVFYAISSIFMYPLMKNNKFKFSKNPILIAITGDSSSGKTTLTKSLVSFFGIGASLIISGDDYHKYERGHKMWKKGTHLNPEFNNLDKLEKDIRKLHNYQKVFSTTYDHKTGNFTEEKKFTSKEIILVEGLHSLYRRSLNKIYDLKIYIEIEENLRKKLKIERDIKVRNKKKDEVLKSLEARAKDSLEFIHPQKENSDLAFRLNSVKENKVDLDVSIKNIYLDFMLFEKLLRKLNIDFVLHDYPDIRKYKIKGHLKSFLFSEIFKYFSDEDIFLLSNSNSKISQGNIGIINLLTIMAIDSISNER